LREGVDREIWINLPLCIEQVELVVLLVKDTDEQPLGCLYQVRSRIVGIGELYLFLINNQEILLNTFDTYDIPVDVEHEVIGVEEENVFILTKTKYFK